MLTLSETDVAALRAALLSDEGEDLIHFMGMKRMSQPLPPAVQRTAPLAHRLGWITGPHVDADLTDVGNFVGDSMREFMFWRDGAQEIYCQEQVPALRPERLAGKRVVEIGCGFGRNLLTLVQHVDDVIGVDPIPIYLQIAPALFEREGLRTPELKLSRAEALDLPTASRDVVFMLGALQYMDIPKAISEAARVLVPGGQFIAINGYYGGFARGIVREARSGGALRSTLLDLRTALFDTPYFHVTGKRYRGDGKPTTSIPVYLPRRRQERILADAGLKVSDETRIVGEELAMVAYKQ